MGMGSVVRIKPIPMALGHPVPAFPLKGTEPIYSLPCARRGGGLGWGQMPMRN